MTETLSPSNFLTRLALDGQSDMLLDSLPVGIEIYAADGTLLYMNKANARIFGADREAVMKAGINIADDPCLPDVVKQAARTLTEIHTRFRYDPRTVNKQNYFASSGSRVMEIDCQGKPMIDTNSGIGSYVFIMEDISEIARKEEELAHSNRKTEIAIRDSGIMLWEFDAKKRLFYSDNEPLNAYNRSKPIPIELYVETVHPDDREPLHEIMERMLRMEDFSFTFEGRILFPDNPEWQHCTVNGSPYERDARGRVVKYVGTRKNNHEIQKRKLLQDNILNSIPLPIYIKDIEDNYRFVFCNEESKRMFGTSVDKTAPDLMDPEYLNPIQQNDLEVFTTGKPYTGMERIILRDGRSYDTIMRKSIIYDGGKRLLLTVAWDQGLQNDLRRRDRVLSSSLEALHAYTWVYEPDIDRMSFSKNLKSSGRDLARLESLEQFTKAIHPEDRQQFHDSFREFLENSEGEWQMEFRLDLDGSSNYEWWQTRALLETVQRNNQSTKYTYGISIDIDTSKKTELNLRRHKEELANLVQQNELVLNNTNSGLAYISTDYVVQWENISICSASISSEAYKKGELCYKSTHGRSTPCENCVLQRAMKSGQLEQITFTLNDGHSVEIFATPVFKEGVVDGIVIRIDDVTQRVRMIAELRQAKADAEQSDKLKSAFLANMSHEIRTPLNAIVGFSELLLTDPETEDRDEYIRIIKNNNELLLKLISDILDLSKIEAGSVELKYEDFDLSEYFDGIAASMQQRIKNPGVELRAVNPHPVCCVHLDKNRIAQIFTNYVTNAIKYTPEGTIEMGYQSSAEGIRFYVRDTGIGIPEEKKEKVFHRFEKLDEFAQGTGLGLSICKAIAESMGGSVGFESEYGKGSTFWAFLPCKPETGMGADFVDETPEEQGDDQESEKDIYGDSPISEGAGQVPRRKRVLIVEDIPSNFLLVSSLLKAHYELIHAKNGQEAVYMVREEHPDLVLMDMRMPLMDGMTATSEIRKFDQDIPIVALTAHAFNADRDAALAIGCDDYLIKPVNKDELMGILEKYNNNSRKAPKK